MFGIKGYFIAILVAFCLLCTWGIVRSCRKFWEPPKPPKMDSFFVVRATTGASLECSKIAKGKRTRTVTLIDIAAPVDGPLAEASRANLERIAGKTIRVETERHGLLRSDPQASQRRLDEEPNATAEAPEARGPIVGVVFGESGSCLQLEQIMSSMAKCLRSAPADWHKQEAITKKKKLGVWK